MLVAARDAFAAGWVLERWSSSFAGQLVPDGFAACARLFHPARLGERPVRWADVAAHFGTRVHPRMEFHPLTRGHPYHEGVPGLYDQPPREDWLPDDLVQPLVEILRAHTEQPERCTFGIWCGYGDLTEDVHAAPELRLPGRVYHLFDGALADGIAYGSWGAAIWWPADRAWFVGSDTDLRTTYVGGTPELVRDLVASPHLEACEVSPDTTFASRGDELNA